MKTLSDVEYASAAPPRNTALGTCTCTCTCPYDNAYDLVGDNAEFPRAGLAFDRSAGHPLQTCCASLVAMRALLVALCAGVSATDPFVVTFDVTLATGKKDSFDLEVQPEWAPLGAARFKELVDEEFFTSVRFFRVLPGFMAQFGIHGKPEISSTWRDRKLSGIDTAQC